MSDFGKDLKKEFGDMPWQRLILSVLGALVVIYGTSWLTNLVFDFHGAPWWISIPIGWGLTGYAYWKYMRWTERQDHIEDNRSKQEN